jgi:hypothetical protein
VHQAAGSLAGMGPAQLARPSLILGGQVAGVVTRAMRPVGQSWQAVLAVVTQLRAYRFVTPVAFGDLYNRNAAGDDLHDGVRTLLDDAQLYEHQSRLPPTRHQSREADPRTAVSPIIWSQRVTHQPESDNSVTSSR